MKFVTYLNFSGTCEQAFRFYADALGGKLTQMMKVGDSPMADQAPPGARDRIMHARLETPDGGVLMGGDHPFGDTVKPTGFCVSVQVRDRARAEQLFRALAAGGSIQMPFATTFWSQGFGMCTDRFQTPWMVNCE